MPAHSHSFNASQQPPNTDDPAGSVLADFPAGTPIYNNQVPPNVAMNPQSVGVTGGNAPVPVRDPYLVLRWCVATTGIYPSRP